MANQHFFKPLLPGFDTHLKIPEAFFLKNIQGRYEKKIAELRSDASKITWKVKIDGLRLTNGWKEFALAHDLRIGDFLVFRQERDLCFHVTILGPNCCEIQYGSCLDNQNNYGKIQSKKNPRREAESSLDDPSCFMAYVTPSSLRRDTLNLPMRFVRANGLDTRCGQMILMNKKGRSWTLDLKRRTTCATTYIRGGWKSFCRANGLRAGSFFTFKLIQRVGTMVLRLTPKELEEEEEEEEEDCSPEATAIEYLSTEANNDEDKNKDRKRREKSICNASSSASQNRFVTVTLTAFNVGLSKVVLPIHFTKVNNIKKAKKLSLLDKHGVKWSTNLCFEVEHERMALIGGWKEFCFANGAKIGESITLELIWEADRSSVLKFSFKVKPENKSIL